MPVAVARVPRPDRERLKSSASTLAPKSISNATIVSESAGISSVNVNCPTAPPSVAGSVVVAMLTVEESSSKIVTASSGPKVTLPVRSSLILSTSRITVSSPSVTAGESSNAVRVTWRTISAVLASIVVGTSLPVKVAVWVPNAA